MPFKSFLTRSLPLAAFVLAGSLMADTNVSDTLKQIKSRAHRLSVEADTLQSLTYGSRTSWETHSAKLNEVRDHINAIGQDLQYLQSVQSFSEPWQAEAIDRMVPSAAMVADKTEAAIGLLNDNRSHIRLPGYTDHVRLLSEHADRLKDTINPFVELDQTQQKLEEIQNSLELNEVDS